MFIEKKIIEYFGPYIGLSIMAVAVLIVVFLLAPMMEPIETHKERAYREEIEHIDQQRKCVERGGYIERLSTTIYETFCYNADGTITNLHPNS